MMRRDTNKRTAVSKFFDVVLDLSGYPRVSVSFCQDKMCTDSSSGQSLAHQHCISGLIPSNSLHLLSCAQITIVNHERVVDAPSCHVLLSFVLILSCSSAMRIGSTCSSYAMYTPAAVRDVRQFVFLILLPTGKPWVEVAVSSFSLCKNSLSLPLDHQPVCLRLLLHEQLSVLHHQPHFRQTVAANQATDHPSQDLHSTFPSHNSGTNFRSWVSIGLTGVVNAIPAGEHED